MDHLFGIPIVVLIPTVAMLFAGGVAAVAALAWRNRVLMRLAMRNVPRRPARSALVAVGLCLATVIVSTALNTGDTMRSTVRSLVAGTVGRADEVIVQPRRDARRSGFDVVASVADGSFLTGTLESFDEAVYQRLAAQLQGDSNIAALMPAIVETVVATNLANGEVLPRARLFGLPRTYPEVFGRLHGRDGQPASLTDLEPGQLVLNVEAATALAASPGDAVRLTYGDRQLDLVVATIATSTDLAGAQPLAIVPLDDLQAITGQPGRINQILVANRGDAADSVQLSGAASRAIRPLLVDDQAAVDLHAALRGDTARAALTAMLPTFDDATRERLESLLRELDRDAPTAEFKAIVSDPDLERRLFGLGARLAAPGGRSGAHVPSLAGALRVIEIKRASQELADRWTGALTNAFLFLGLFSLATGAMLVVLIFTLLAAERRTEMGLLRALGATRSHLAQMFVMEGLAYDLVAAALGIAVGVAVALALIHASGQVLAGFGISVKPRVQPGSLLLSYCLGGSITMLCIVLASWRASQVSPAAAMRDMGETPHADRGGRSAALWLLPAPAGLGLLAAGSRTGAALPLAGGVVLVVLGLVGLARHLAGRLPLSRPAADRLAFSAGGAALIAFWLAPADPMGLLGANPSSRGMELFVLAGLSLVLGATWIVVFNLAPLARAAAALGHRWPTAGVVARAGLAYAAVQTVRTGLAIAMFALVIFCMVVASVLLTGTHRAYSDPSAMAGGFDLRVDQVAEGAADLHALLPDLSGLAARWSRAVGTLRRTTAEAIQPGPGAHSWRVTTLNLADDAFLGATTAGFATRARGFADDRAVWRALAEQPGLAVIAGPAVGPRDDERRRFPGFRLEGTYQGDWEMEPLVVWLRDPRGGRAVRLTVIGVIDPRAAFGPGIFTSERTLAGAGAPVPSRATYYVQLADGTSPYEVALALDAHVNRAGLRASEIGEEARRVHDVRALLNGLLQSFIGVGLVAGIAGLGVISMRVVVERRQQIGVLRALGFTGRAVQAAFLLESALVALLGIGCGVALGAGLSFRLVQRIGREFPEIVFSFPAWQVALISLGAFLAALAMTAIPAYQAGRIEPARALRYE